MGNAFTNRSFKNYSTKPFVFKGLFQALFNSHSVIYSTTSFSISFERERGRVWEFLSKFPCVCLHLVPPPGCRLLRRSTAQWRWRRLTWSRNWGMRSTRPSRRPSDSRSCGRAQRTSWAARSTPRKSWIRYCFGLLFFHHGSSSRSLATVTGRCAGFKTTSHIVLFFKCGVERGSAVSMVATRVWWSDLVYQRKILKRVHSMSLGCRLYSMFRYAVGQLYSRFTWVCQIFQMGCCVIHPLSSFVH